MAADYAIKTGSVGEAIDGALTDATGAAMILTAKTVKFWMYPIGSSTPKVNGAAAVVDNALGGLVHYQWVAGDLDTPGLFIAHWEVLTGGVAAQRFPEGGWLTIEVKRATGG